MGKRKSDSNGASKLKKQRIEEDKILSSAFSNSLLESHDFLPEEDEQEAEERLENGGQDSDELESDWENEEQEYETQPRSLNQNRKVLEGLPIKTQEGQIQRRIIEEQEPQAELEEEEEEEAEPVVEVQEELEEVYVVPDNLTESQKLVKLQEDIAEMVEKIIEQPEENMSSLTRLRKMSESKNVLTARYSLLAIVHALKSVIPGYRIRPLTEIEKKEKVTKEVARLRAFEQALLANYKAYINILVKYSKTHGIMARAAITAVSQLLRFVAHFNFVENLLGISVRFVSKYRGELPVNTEDSGKQANIQLFHSTIAVLQDLLVQDITYGKVSLDLCRIVSRTLKLHKYMVNKDVVGLYLSLSILEDYDPQSDKPDQPAKINKKNRVHRSKKERKAMKERKVIEEEMRAAELQVSQKERDQNQAEILKILLANYLHILKTKNDHLMATVLEGLAKYGFMANVELVGDFLEILKELMFEISTESLLSDHRVKQILFCIITSFTLVSSYKVAVDMTKFIDVLYSILLDISVDEEINKSIKLLIRTLETIFLKTKGTIRARNLGFTKRLYMLMLNTTEKPTLSLVNFMRKFIDKAPEIKGLFNVVDRVQNGTFIMDADHPNRSNPEAATIWENALLVHHYCPSIQKSAKSILKLAK